MSDRLPRRSFLKLAGATAAAIAGGELFVACAPTGSELSETSLTPEQVRGALGDAIGEPKHTPVESEERKSDVDRQIVRYREIQGRVVAQVVRLAEYVNSTYRMKYQIYVPKDIVLPPKDQLDKTLDFLKAHHGFEWAPAKESTMFISDLGPDLGTYSGGVILDTSRVWSLVNVNAGRGMVEYGDPFLTEFCQAAFVNARPLDQRKVFGTPQEVICNRFSIAAKFARAKKPFDEYDRDAPTKGYGVVVKDLFVDTQQEIEIGRYDRKAYQELVEIFGSSN